MNLIKLPSLLLAAALQLLPLTRVVVATSPATGSSFAIVSTWMAGAVALLGSYDAVSGASTVINSPKTASATNAVAFSYRITTGPEVGNTFAATPLPSGLTVSTTSGRITGTPTVDGVFVIHLTASDNNQASRTVTADLNLTIMPPGNGGGTAPTINSQPASQTVTAGGNASFSVTASGTAPLTYQWRLNGANLGGANAATLSLTGVSTNQAGSYTVIVGNSTGSITSSPAMLTVNPAPVPPAITAQPASQSITEGGNATFTVSASGNAPLTYQWRFNGANLGGANTATLNLTGVSTNQAGSYTVFISNAAGSITSSPASLTVIPAIVAPAITAPPVNQSVLAGNAATFSVTANGTAPLSYQWRFNGTDLAGANAATLTIPGATTNQGGSYTVFISNAAGSITSSPAILTVNQVVVAPTIVTPPASQTVTAGNNVIFSVGVNGTAPLNYQWRLNGVSLGGATNLSLTLPNVTTNQAGSYTVFISNSAGAVTSSPASLIVNLLILPPVITAQPAIQTVMAGSNVVFSVFATGTAPFSYQWRKNGANIGGATTATLNLPNVTTNQAGSYTVVVTNPAGSATSLPAVLTVNFVPVNTAPVISVIADQTISMNQATPPIPFTIGDLETAAANLTLTASSTNTTLLPVTGIVFGGANGNRTLMLTPANGMVGESKIIVTVSDGVATASTTFQLVVESTASETNHLTLIKNGSGTVTPDLSGTTLTPGNIYTVTALPATGYQFAGWSVGLASASPTISFVLPPSLVLVATFVPNPFLAAQGSYSGLFREDDQVRPTSAGSFAAKVTLRGTFSGRLQLGTRSYSFSGQLDQNGQATNVIVRANQSSLTLEFSIGRGADVDQILGSVTDGNWVATLQGDRAGFDSKTQPSPFVGQYTLILAGRDNDPSVPAGDGFGIVRVDAGGKVKFTGMLPDGTKLSQSAVLSKNGDWPLFVPVYSGNGALMSRLAFTNQASSDVSGVVSWIKPADGKSKYYPNGFARETVGFGSIYQRPSSAAGRVLNLANATVSFTGGNLATDFANGIALGSNGRVTNLSDNRLSLSFSTSTGTFRGQVVDPASGASRNFSGAVIQKLNASFGFMPGLDQSSRVAITAP